jgi:peptide/nickel transport system substrate-binding protein
MTQLKKNPGWWGLADRRFEGNIDEVMYRPIKSDATRMAALVVGRAGPGARSAAAGHQRA